MKAQASHKATRRESPARDFMRALLKALGVHVAAFGLLWLGSLSWEATRPEIAPSFTLVDASPYVDAEREEQLAEAQAEAAERRLEQARREEAERQAALELEREQESVEEEREATLERQRQQQLEREAEQARLAEQQRQEELQRQLDRERREAEQARLRELEDLRRRREEAQREREEQERRLAEIAEQREQEREREEARQRAAAEAERLRLAREQAAAEERRGTLREEYVATIAELVRRNWSRPPTTQPGVQCRVRVVQIPSGVIIDQAVASPCNADQVTRESIISAVERTEQLPYEGYEDVFEREIDFIFRYDGD